MKKIIAFAIFNFTFLIFNCFPQQLGWEIVPSGTTNSLHSVYFTDYNTGWAVGEAGTILKSNDGGLTWQSIPSTATNHLNDVFTFNDSTVLAVGDSGLVVFSHNGGSFWYVNHFLSEDYYSVSFSENNGLIGGSSQTILYCDFYETGITFNTAQTGLFGGGFWGAYMLSPQFGFVAGENSIFQPLLGRTTDSGFNWNFSAFYLNTNEGRATGVDFTDLNTGYVSASVWDGTGAIAKTTDGGSNWISTMFSNPLWSIDFPISGAGQVGYAVGSQGTILKTYNAGTNWQPQLSGTSLRLNKVHFKDFDFGFAVGENGLILRTTSGGEPVTFVENGNQTPHSFELFQNYPNPFNPTTKIKFTLTPSLSLGERVSEGRVRATLKVYDVLGNEIATLVNEELSAGEYEVEFNATGHSGEVWNLPSGIYFYKLQSGKFSETRKMILIK